jgi:hypothetical protein
MSSNEATIITAARVWAQTLAELEEAKRQVEADSEVEVEVAMHEIAARVEALKSAELVLLQAVQLSAGFAASVDAHRSHDAATALDLGS